MATIPSPLPETVPATLDLLLATLQDVQMQWVLWIRSNFDNTFRPYLLGDLTANPSKEHLISAATFTIPFGTAQLSEIDVTNQIREGVEVKCILTTKGFQTSEINYNSCMFHGFVKEIQHSDVNTVLVLDDPIGAALNSFYFNYGELAAQAIKLLHDVNDPTDNIANAGTKGIVLVPVTENDEQRWVIPDSINANALYGDAYVGAVSDGVYSGSVSFAGISPYGSGSFTFTAGSNRRTWKMAAKVYDTGMDITTSNPDILYVGSGTKLNPLSPDYWRVGTDTQDYIQLIGYIPAGILYLEWVLIYIEGTNDIEHIFQKIVNPDITGAVDEAASISATVLQVVSPSDFFRDDVRVGATIYNTTTGNSATITKRYRRKLITTSITGNWNPQDSFKIVDGCGISPRWRDGIHFNLSGAYNVKTIYPSFATVNSVTWNAENGSAGQFLAKLYKDNAPPNYHGWWDHEYCMFRSQFVEVTPHNVTTKYYSNGYGLYKSPYTEPGTNDAHEVNIAEDLNMPRSMDLFATRVLVEGVASHPINLLKQDSQIVSMPPGDAVTGWNNNSQIYPGVWRAVKELGDHGSEPYPGFPANLYDMNADTIFAWEGTTGIGEGDTFAPIYVFDLLSSIELGRIRLWGMNSGRPEFTFGLRIEICDDNAILNDGTQDYINPDAAWQLVNKNFYDYHLKSFEEVNITDFLTAKGRYVMVSMRPAKTNTEKWVKAGLADIQFFRRNVSTGEARVADLTEYLSSTATNASPSATVLQDSTATFITDGVAIGDTIKRVASSQSVLVTAVNSETEIVTASVTPNTWASGNVYNVTKAVGAWVVYRADDSDNALALIHLPKLANQMFAPRPADYSLTGNEIVYGHKSAYYNDKSLSAPNACMLRAQEYLYQMLRTYKIVGLSVTMNAGIRLYHTLLIYNPKYGITFKALVENIRINAYSMSIDATFFGTTAWTGETVEQPDV